MENIFIANIQHKQCFVLSFNWIFCVLANVFLIVLSFSYSKIFKKIVPKILSPACQYRTLPIYSHKNVEIDFFAFWLLYR